MQYRLASRFKHVPAWVGAAWLALLVGCRTPGPARVAAPPGALSPSDLAAARGLAHFVEGLIEVYDSEDGRRSTNALEHLVASAATAPAEPRLYSHIAAIALLQGRPELAIETLERARQAAPESAEVRLDLATIYQIAGQKPQALRNFADAVRLAPTNATGYLALASLLLCDGQTREALARIEQGMRQVDAAGRRALLALCNTHGIRLCRSGDADSAIRCFEFAARHSPEDRPGLYLLMGEIREEQGQTDAALRYYGLAVALASPPPQAVVRLALIELRTDPEQALRRLTAARQRLPDDLLIPLALGQIYSSLGRLPEAVATFDEIAAQASRPPPRKLSSAFYLQYGALCERAGLPQKGERICAEGLAAHPDDHPILNYLAYTWAEKGTNLDLACDYVTRALEMEPDNGAYVDTLGWVYYRQKRYTEASVELEKAVQLMQDDPTITEHLGDAYHALGENDKATEQWRRSLVLNPDNKPLSAKLQAAGVNPADVLKEAPPAGEQNRAVTP